MGVITRRILMQMKLCNVHIVNVLTLVCEFGFKEV